jgi:hypothetical protein
MSSPFLGMNPYLENPDLWSEVHHRLITAIANNIESHLHPKYRVAIEKRTYRIDSEDSLLINGYNLAILLQQKYQNSATTIENKSVTVTLPSPLEIKEGYLEIREVSTGKVVTIIEILSPTNKKSKEGRKSYLDKRDKIFESDTNLVEIDLIRTGEQMPMITHIPDTDYRILVVRSHRLPSAQLFPFSVRETIPNFTIPLQKSEPEIEVNIQTLLLAIYEKARFDLTLDYNIPPIPDLSVENQEWMDLLLKEQGRRK